MNNPSLEEMMGPKPTIVRTGEDALHIEWAVDDGNMTGRIGLAMDNVNYRESTLVVVAGKKSDSPMSPMIFGVVLPPEVWDWVSEQLAPTWDTGLPLDKGNYVVHTLDDEFLVLRWNGRKWIHSDVVVVDKWMRLPEIQ